MLRGDLIPLVIAHYVRERSLHFFAQHSLSLAFANEQTDLYELARFELLADAEQRHKGVNATVAVINGEAFDNKDSR